jgi:uncharacterized protein (TIGR02147 family)
MVYNIKIVIIYNYLSYKKFVRGWIGTQPKKGYGAFRRMAEHLNVSTTMVSQVFSGEKHISLEMAADLSSFFGFSHKEERYFFLLVELERAGSKRLQDKLLVQAEELKNEAQKVIERVARDKELSAEDKATYYSTWLYTGIRNLVATASFQSVESIAMKLQIPINQVRLSLQFLTDRGLIKLKEGRFEVLAKATHIGADDPLVIKHHQNWRLRSMQKMDARDPQHLYYTGPMSLSAADADRLRQLILDFIQATNKIVVESPSEVVRCLNIDWFEY